jgi:diguanylate cyclase (GGDEF)-like protein
MVKKDLSRITIGLLIDWTEEPYQIKIFNGVVDFAEEYDINLLTFVIGGLNAPREYERTRNVIANLITKNNVDALIVLSGTIANYIGPEAMNDYCMSFKNIPIVSIALELKDFPSVLVDNKGMLDLVRHLIEVHSYKRIAFIKGPDGNAEAQDRYSAYVEALKMHNIELDDDLVVDGKFTLESGMEAVNMLLDKRKVKFDAIISANDNMAMGAFDALQIRNVKVPREVAVVGFDDIEMGKYAILPLTTVRQPLYEQGKVSGELAIKLIQGEEIEPVKKIQTKLIIRESCGCFSLNTIKAASNAFEKTKLFEDNMVEKHILLNEINKIIKDLDQYEKLIYSMLFNEIVESLLNEIKSVKSNDFIKIWNEVISVAIAKGFNLYLLHDVISILRQNLLPFIDDRNMMIHIEDIFQQARVMLAEASQRADSFQKILELYEMQSLREIGERLMSALNIDEQMSILYEELPRFGIKSCYLSLYDNSSDNLEYSKLMLAFNENGRINIEKGGPVFLSNKLVPDNLIDKTKRFKFIIEELSDGNDHIGFVLFEIGAKEAKIYEILRNNLSNALKVSLLIEKIKKQAQSLEEQVKERTIDLTKSNMQLQKEIAERRKTEMKLKEALSELEKSNDQLRSLSLKDELTGLYNRRGFLTLGEQHLKLARRMNKEFIVFFIDLDGLKIINDTYGHKEGDYVLFKAGEIIKKTFRQADIIARIGGDEFTVLSVDTAKNDEDEIKKRLFENIKDYNDSSKKPYNISMSLGYSHYHIDKTKVFESLISEADEMLYKEKKLKKGSEIYNIKKND